MNPAEACPCGSTLAYGRCCGPLHGGAPAARLHERSRFERVDGRWTYVDGDHD